MRRLLLLLTCLVSLCGAADAREPIPIYSYHTDPPFHLPQISTDLSRAFVDTLNDYSFRKKLDLQFKLVTITRPKLNQRVEAGNPYMILWANALWFQHRDPEVRSSAIIFWDADVWISLKQKPVPFELPQDLLGKRIGIRDGYFYKGISPLIEAGQIQAVNSASDDSNFQRLKSGEIDAFVMSRSSLLYWFANGFDAHQVYVAQSPHDAFNRHLLYSKHYDPIGDTLNHLLKDINQDPHWQNKLKFWGVDSLTSPFELELDELIQYPVK